MPAVDSTVLNDCERECVFRLCTDASSELINLALINQHAGQRPVIKP